MEKKPNIFDYATSELSQDAFLAWLIQWANKEYQKVDSALHACATSFVQELLDKDKSYSIETVEVRKQWHNIDVSALVNNEYFLLVENKKGSKEHSDQLNRYLEIAKAEHENSGIEIKPVYFKMEEQGDYEGVKQAGFEIFKRDKMLSILSDYIDSTERSKQNDIIVDYYKYLDDLDKKIKSYQTESLDKWHWYSWQGFYSELQKRIGDGKWDYVSNPAGGFLGFWWHFKYGNLNGSGYDYYLLIEQGKFCFKVYPYNQEKETRRMIRDHYRAKLFDKAPEHNIQIQKSGRSGKHMTVAILSSEFRELDENGLIDIKKTVEKIREIQAMVDSI